MPATHHNLQPRLTNSTLSSSSPQTVTPPLLGESVRGPRSARFSPGLHPSSCAHLRHPGSHPESHSDSDSLSDNGTADEFYGQEKGHGHGHGLANGKDRSVEDVVEDVKRSTVVVEVGAHPPHPPLSLGAGFFISSTGFIVTNAHVVEDAVGGGVGRGLTVTTHTGRTYPAHIHAIDVPADLAVVRIDWNGPARRTGDGDEKEEEEEWTPVTLGDAGKVRTASPLLTLGHPLGLHYTLSSGTCSHPPRPPSSVHRADPRLRFLQTTTPLFPGSSGGPVFTAAGEVVGVATVRVEAQGGEGVGFAVGVDKGWREGVRRMVCRGQGQGIERGFWGVEGDETYGYGLGHSSTKSGARLTKVLPGSPAYEAGLRAGDVIVRADGYPVKDWYGFVQRVGWVGGGAPVRIGVVKEEKGGRSWSGGGKDKEAGGMDGRSVHGPREERVVTVVPGRVVGGGVGGGL
ncbi:hypothetical protein HDU93_009263 [Gonapodya sp. JEL0774]|nr:hypothetical protein HDU93_009263 [Gonapodya sp. JEL0774]